jgi:hypothetical protein
MDDHERFLSRRQQAERYGKSTKTIERWGDNPSLGFPAEIDVNGHKYRALSKLEAWERKRAAAAKAAPRKGWGAERRRSNDVSPVTVKARAAMAHE